MRLKNHSRKVMTFYEGDRDFSYVIMNVEPRVGLD